MDILLKKITLVDDRKLEVEYSEQNDEGYTVRDYSVKSQFPVHNDLKKAFRNLVPHLLLINELKSDKLKDLKKQELLDYDVHILHIKSKDSGDGIILSGTKRLSNHKVISLNTPYTLLDDEDYQYNTELSADITLVINEAKEYLKGKFDDSQKDMFKQDPEEEETEEVLETVN